MNQNLKKQLVCRIERAFPHSISLNIAQTANVLGKEKNTLNIWRSQGIGPPYLKIAGGVRYPIDELAEFMASQMIQTV